MIKLINILNEITIKPSYNPSINRLGIENDKLIAIINQKHTNMSSQVITGTHRGMNIYGPRNSNNIYYDWNVYFKSPNKVVIEISINVRGSRMEFDPGEWDDYELEVEETKKLLKPYNPEIIETEGTYGDSTEFILNANIFSNYKEVYDQWNN
jgi:hypothetical protein